jgi:hypothetical protein
MPEKNENQNFIVRIRGELREDHECWIGLAENAQTGERKSFKNGKQLLFALLELSQLSKGGPSS